MSTNNSDSLGGIVVDSITIRELQSVLFGNESTAEDINRWFNQGFEFCSNPTFGLRQRSAGPCGVLAAAQSEIIKYVYFEILEQSPDDAIMMPEAELLEVALCKAIQTIIQRASTTENVCIALETGTNTSYSTFEQFHWKYLQVSKGDDCFEAIYNNLDQFRSRTGCLLLVLSLVFSRNIENIKADMDTPSNALIGQFGHTTQELINLLLIGKATSNAIDGNEMIGNSGLVLRGVPERSSAGYLTHLEAFGHYRVGDFYKYPDYPIWIVGSSSHYSVLFSFDRSINEQSSTERLLTDLRKAFNAADYDKCGFIPSSKLEELLLDLGLSSIVSNYSDYQRVQRAMQVEGDIIVWDSFWQILSKLMTGSSIDEALNQKQPTNRGRSDSEVARQLQAAFDSGVEPDITNQDWTTGLTNDRPRSDSDLARAIQLSLNGEGTMTDNNIFNEPDDVNRMSIANEESEKVEPPKVFKLIYFNGLEGPWKTPKLVPFTITADSVVARIGGKISLVSSNAQGDNFCPMEEVLRTRWPNASINWHGSPIPSID